MHTVKMNFKYFLAIFWFGLSFSSCRNNNVQEDNSLKKYFDQNNVTGTFGLFDNMRGNFTLYNLARYRDSAYLPASTFKIINSLIGIETGVIDNESMMIPWDGVRRRPEWDRDLTMAQAFKASAVPYYQEVARRIGKPRMQLWLDSLHYGSARITTAIDTFWLDNSLKITPDEQLGLVKQLYFSQLPFQKRTQQIVRKVMVQESNANYTLAYKSGWGHTPDGKSLGWLVGWVEENKHPYFFVLNLSAAPDADPAHVSIHILKGILGKLGFLEGKK